MKFVDFLKENIVAEDFLVAGGTIWSGDNYIEACIESEDEGDYAIAQGAIVELNEPGYIDRTIAKFLSDDDSKKVANINAKNPNLNILEYMDLDKYSDDGELIILEV